MTAGAFFSCIWGEIVKNSSKKWLLAFVVLIFIISLVPILWIGLFNHPSADDYSNSYITAKVLKETGSVGQVLKTAFNKAYETYYTWQGTYFSAFIMTLQPAIFGDGYYAITTFLVVLAFIFANLYFLKKLLVDFFKLDKVSWLIVSLIIMLVSMQFVPKPVSAFYWFNASILYTFTYALSLIMLGLVVDIILEEKMKKIYINTAIASLLAIIIGGGNFVTAMMTVLLLVFVAIYLIVKKSDKLLPILMILAVALGCFLVSVLAPGNGAREGYYEGLSPVVAIAKSLFYGLIYITRTEWGWIMSPVAVIMLCVLCVLFMTKIIGDKKYSFKYPLLVMFLSFCIFSAQFAPTLYTTAGSGPPRLKNVIFFSYVLLMVFNLTYLTGWIYKRIERFHVDKDYTFRGMVVKVYRKHLISFAFLILFLGGLFCANDVLKTTSVSATLSLLSGQAQQYSAEYYKRVSLLNSDEKDVVLDPYSVKPYVLFFDDISDPPDWKNLYMEKYYQKDSIKLR
jgi:hypothetical protein